MAKSGFKKFSLMVSVLLAVIMQSQPVIAETMTKEQGDAILKELSELRKILQRIDARTASAPQGRRGPPPTATVPVVGGSKIGSSKAPLTMVEFTDYQCPFCARFYKQTFPLLKKKYIDTGKLQLIVKDLPLGFHKNARKAAQASRCAGEQDRFFEMHTTLLDNGKNLQEKYLIQYAEKVGIDVKKFKNCISSNRYLKTIDQNTQQAQKQGVSGTPTFVLGKTHPKIISGPRIVGAQPFNRFEQQIEKMLKK